jgi:hypothetical protein
MVTTYPALSTTSNPAYNPASLPAFSGGSGGGAIPADAFVFQIDTTKPGTSTNTDFQLPIYTTGNYNFDIEWGDGSSETVTSDSILVHTYPAPGVYQISITGTIEGFATFGNGDPSKNIKYQSMGCC